MIQLEREERARQYACPRCKAEPGALCHRMGSRGPRPDRIRSCHEARLALLDFRRVVSGGHILIQTDLDNGVFAVTVPAPGTTTADLERVLQITDEIATAIRHELTARKRQEEQLSAMLCGEVNFDSLIR